MYQTSHSTPTPKIVSPQGVDRTTPSAARRAHIAPTPANPSRTSAAYRPALYSTTSAVNPKSYSPVGTSRAQATTPTPRTRSGARRRRYVAAVDTASTSSTQTGTVPIGRVTSVSPGPSSTVA